MLIIILKKKCNAFCQINKITEICKKWQINKILSRKFFLHLFSTVLIFVIVCLIVIFLSVYTFIIFHYGMFQDSTILHYCRRLLIKAVKMKLKEIQDIEDNLEELKKTKEKIYYLVNKYICLIFWYFFLNRAFIFSFEG